MLKIRALNESSSSSEEEDEDHPRLSVEAQEAQAKLLYEKAQRLTIQKEFEQAVQVFAEILQLPYLNVSESEKNKTMSPVQLQLRLGCLKCLSTLYTRGSTKNLEDASTVLELITEMEPKNVNFWYRLGKVALERRELELAFDAFVSALECSPGHWGSIENLVTISFALHDLFGCLRFCAIGLSKDPGFLKGYIFKNEVFKCHPWTREVVKGNNEYESLFAKEHGGGGGNGAAEYLTDAKNIIVEIAQRKAGERRREEDVAKDRMKCPFTLKTLTLSELGNLVFEVYNYLKGSRTLLQLVDLSTTAQSESTATNDEQQISVVESSQPVPNQLPNGDCNGDEGISCASVTLRSRSTSDDKEPVRDSGNDSSRQGNDCSQVSETDDKMMEEDSQTMLPPIGPDPDQTEEEMNAQRKKNKKDMKWWQMEGQRRSQRVRGNLVAAPIKAKPESTFAETLRNVIPEVLLVEESSCSSSKKEKIKKSSPLKISLPPPPKRTYFGSSDEKRDVQQLLTEWKGVDILHIITRLVRWLSRTCNKAPWPSELRTSFLQLYSLYKASIPSSSWIALDLDLTKTEEMDGDALEDDIFTLLTHTELTLSNSVSDNVSASTNLFLLSKSGEIVSSDEFALRLEWLKFKHNLVHGSKNGDTVLDHFYTKQHLNYILDLLRKKGNATEYECIIPTETDFVISCPVVEDKLKLVQKIENLSKIEELYGSKRYEELVEILQFSLTMESGEDNFQNRMYLTESYLHLGKVECVEHCEILLQSLGKSGVSSEEKLVSLLHLLTSIWNGMKSCMETKEYKIMINMLLKILIRVEKQEGQGVGGEKGLLTEPWILLHSVLFHLEQMESAFLIDDESVPGSILILQLGHEILSKIGKCCSNQGHFLSYTISSLLELEGTDMYWSFEETKTCLDQAILCLYSHPAKKFKLKNLKDHGGSGTAIPLDWAACVTLYKYFCLEELPEFDSKTSKSISAEVENLFQRMIPEMPEGLKKPERLEMVKAYVNGTSDAFIEEPLKIDVEVETPDIYYLLADFHLKNQDFEKAVDFYMWDLTLSPSRYDSWTAIALTKTEDVVSKINACDAFKIDQVLTLSDTVIRCFQQSIGLDVANSKVRIEFGSFLYSLRSVFSREIKFHGGKINGDVLEEVERRRTMYLHQSQSLFEPYKVEVNQGEGEEAKKKDVSLDEEDDAWINHYMLGKVAEKMNPFEPETFLSQYILAGQLLHAKCATYPSKINYHNPQDNALEALEIYFRIHASVLSFIEKATEYNIETEKTLLKFLKLAEESPFIKSKQGRSTDGEGGGKKRAKTVATAAPILEENISKKDMAIINNLVQNMMTKVEKMVMEAAASSKDTIGGAGSNSSSTSSIETTSSSDDDSNLNNDNLNLNPTPSAQSEPLPPPIPVLKNLSLSSFRDQIRQEEEQRNAKSVASNALHTPAKEVESKDNNGPKDTNVQPCFTEESLKKNHHPDKNPFLKDFSSVPYGFVISLCLKAMKECISRCPQYFKAFYRLSHAFLTFKKDYKKAREYLLGNGVASGANKIAGLYGERKPSTFFNGIWRHPIEDIDRPGSFAFYMAKSMQLLLCVLSELEDHHTLAEVGIQLAKIPDSKNTYLYTEDRELYSGQAFKLCEQAARAALKDKRKGGGGAEAVLKCGLTIYETYNKFQKFNPKENHVAGVLLDAYKLYASGGRLAIPQDPMLADAVRFFQQMVWSIKLLPQGAGGVQKNNQSSPKPIVTGDTTMGKLNVEKQAMMNQMSNSPTTSTIVKKPSSLKRRVPDIIREERTLSSPNSSGGSTFAHPRPLLPIVSTSNLLNFNTAATDMVLAAQLTAYNNALQHQLNSFLNQHQQQQAAVLAAVDPAKLEENVKKMLQQRNNSAKNSPTLGDVSPSSREQLLANLTNAINRRTPPNMDNKGKQLTKQKKGQQSTPTLSAMGSKNRDMLHHMPINIGGGGQVGKTMQAENKKQILSSLKDLPNLSCTKVNTTNLPQKLQSKPDNTNKSSKVGSNTSINSMNSPSPTTLNKLNKSVTPKSSILPNLVSPPYLSCSPFQAQSTAMANPALSRHGKMNNNNNNNNNSSSPQPAHSQAVTQPRYSMTSNLPGHSQPPVSRDRIYPRLTSSGSQPEVVDLTTKSSPEKNNQNVINNNNKSSSQSFSTKGGLDITRMLDTNSSGSKTKAANSKPQYMETSQASVTLTKVTPPPPSKLRKLDKYSQEQRTEYSMTPEGSSPQWEMFLQSHTALQNNMKPYKNKPTMPTRLPGGGSGHSSKTMQPQLMNSNNSSMITPSYNKSPSNPSNYGNSSSSSGGMLQTQNSQDFSMPRVIISKRSANQNHQMQLQQAGAVVVNARPLKRQFPQGAGDQSTSGGTQPQQERPRQQQQQQSHYPLPPKKKHLMIPTNPPAANPSVDFYKDSPNVESGLSGVMQAEEEKNS